MDYAIITYTGVHHLITAEQEKKLQTKGNDEEIIIDGNTVKMRNIADILTIRKYYETYPDKRPMQTESFKIPKEEYEPFDLNKHLMKNRRRITSSIRGIEKHIADMEKDGGKASGFSYNHRDKLNRLLKDFDRNNKIKRESVEVPQSMNYIHN